MLPRFIRFGSSVVLLLSLLRMDAAAETPSQGNQPAGDFLLLAEIFATPGTPDIKGKPWVVVDAGPENWPIEWDGWLIDEDEKEIRLWDWYGEVRKLRKPAAKEKRPVLKEEPDGSIVWNELPGGDGTVAWEIRAEDYNAKSRKFLADGLPKEETDKDALRSVFANPRFDLSGHVVDATRYAHFAHQFGQKEHADELYAHGQKAYAKYADHYLAGNPIPSLPIFVAQQWAFGKRNLAIFSAHRGTPRQELKEKWEKIAAIPHHQYRDEAKAMVKHYESLLKEDAQWEEPDAKALEAFTTEQQVSYWLYHLRDHDMGQMSDPGRCYVLGEFGFELPSQEGQKPNPAVELRKLGLAAVPKLIAHLDDARPSRCKGHWRSYWPEGHVLLCYGDCCQQIFERITGHTIFRSTEEKYPIQAGLGSECKAKAEAWWQEHQKKNPKSDMP